MMYKPHHSVSSHPFDIVNHIDGKSLEHVVRWARIRSDPFFMSHIAKSFVAAVKWDLINHYGVSPADLEKAQGEIV